MNPYRLLALLRAYFNKPDFSARGRLYLGAISSLGRDASPSDIVPDEYGCAESLWDIVDKIFPTYLGLLPIVATAKLYSQLKNSKRFVQVGTPLPGDIIVSPTGTGNGSMANGHTGICGENGIIMSNASATGLFSENYTQDTWKAKYQKVGGFPIYFFRII